MGERWEERKAYSRKREYSNLAENMVIVRKLRLGKISYRQIIKNLKCPPEKSELNTLSKCVY